MVTRKEKKLESNDDMSEKIARAREKTRKTQRQPNCVYKDEFPRSILFHLHQYNTISYCFPLNCYCVLHLIFPSLLLVFFSFCWNFFYTHWNYSIHVFYVVLVRFEPTKTKQNEKKQTPFLFIFSSILPVLSFSLSNLYVFVFRNKPNWIFSIKKKLKIFINRINRCLLLIFF